ncbi:Gfo/Idh/MocA family oxidoreductase [Aestuariirhabdus sp. Z084]|uniref:Gfo/Idh/MocA family protein n=1 Tax=Aestuariirhabdus haliotis TaxID=2918751 RepID=UPI00201B3E53|nr:Gfo/Idh/MocA family oxidoreductase [Aestuariirhabdus haliotis]MCL6416500.1 Gfo/Idh/MocA family oxidoreductase [Aestuariirhabdus haliotis]MCL6420490.1 Gfo/Idh/MocA family oxidoreductase [Aestuariirhabdus haliotis]
MSKTLKVACIGAGYFSQFHYDAWQRIPDTEVVSICNRHLEPAQKIASQYGITRVYTDIDTMLDDGDIDLLDIITPPTTHKAAIFAAAHHGVNAVCQKPFANDYAEAKALTEIAESAGITVCIHENFRFMPWFRHTHQLLQQEALGTILNARFALRPGDGQGSNAYLDRQPYFQTMERFLVHETAVHFVDCFRYLFGEPCTLYASLRRCNPVIKGEDSATILFDYDNGLAVTIDGNRLLDHPSSNTRRTFGEMWIEGTAGTLRLDGEGRLFLRKFSDNQEFELDYQWQDQGFGGDCVYQLNQHVANHFLSGTPLENSARQYLRNIEIEEAIYRSDSEGRRLSISS